MSVSHDPSAPHTLGPPSTLTSHTGIKMKTKRACYGIIYVKAATTEPKPCPMWHGAWCVARGASPSCGCVRQGGHEKWQTQKEMPANGNVLNCFVCGAKQRIRQVLCATAAATLRQHGMRCGRLGLSLACHSPPNHPPASPASPTLISCAYLCFLFLG